MRSDWLRGVFAWEYVNMVVALRCFAFRVLIMQARIWKCFQVQNSTSLLYLPIPSSAETLKTITNEVCQFFSLKLTFEARKVRILENIFLENKNWLPMQDFVVKTLQLVRISLLISAIERVLSFFYGQSFYKSNRKLLSCVCIAWYKHSRHWENSRQLCKPSTLSRVCITVSNSPNPSRVYIRLSGFSIA